MDDRVFFAGPKYDGPLEVDPANAARDARARSLLGWDTTVVVYVHGKRHEVAWYVNGRQRRTPLDEYSWCWIKPSAALYAMGMDLILAWRSENSVRTGSRRIYTRAELAHVEPDALPLAVPRDANDSEIATAFAATRERTVAARFFE